MKVQMFGFSVLGFVFDQLFQVFLIVFVIFFCHRDHTRQNELRQEFRIPDHSFRGDSPSQQGGCGAHEARRGIQDRIRWLTDPRTPFSMQASTSTSSQ